MRSPVILFVLAAILSVMTCGIGLYVAMTEPESHECGNARGAAK